MTIFCLLPLVADLPVEPMLAALTQSWDAGLRILLLIFLVALNAVLVATQVSFSRVHQGQLEDELERGRRGSALALSIVQNTHLYSAACQIGITASSIVLGAIGEPFLTAWILPLFESLSISEFWTRIFAFFVSIVLLTGFHIIAGEQIPKAIGVKRTVTTALACSVPLRVFYILFAGPVWIVEKISNCLLKLVFRMDPTDIAHINHTADELRLIVEETGRAHEVTETEREILRNALELNELCVRDILTPRNEVVVMDVHKTFNENLDIALESKHTRFPLVDGHLDKTLGLIHIKDLLKEIQRESMNLFAAKRDLMHVSETLPLDEMLQEFLGKRAHIALVVDEFGGSVGLVMLDDVLDQVVGEILDEFDDDEKPGFEQIDNDSFVVEGGLPLHELADQVVELDLDNSDVSTVGGYLTSLVGRIPESGEIISIEGYQATVLKADERTVQQIKFTKSPDQQVMKEAGSHSGQDTEMNVSESS
tara:strand:+ start:2689 stop:4131 length:1443 start_codon:yes stop_codon:yes gene_type:complete